MTRAADPDQWVGVVLAGGRSRRMGEDKASLRIGEDTLLNRARKLLSNAGCRDIRVSGRPSVPDGMPDSHPGAGPAHAILDALELARQSGHAGALIIPVDMPGLTVADLTSLIEASTGHGSAWTGQMLPLSVSVRASLPARDKVWSIRRLLDHWDMSWMTPTPEQLDRFANLNTPDDLNRFTGRR